MAEGYPGVEYNNGFVAFVPGPIDVHGHPRAGDTITDFAFLPINGHEGKAGLAAYTETALASGIVAVHAMPNEFIRRFNPDARDGSQTETIPFPISNYDRAMFMERAIGTESRITASYYLGLDPTVIIRDDGAYLDQAELEKNFRQAGERTQGLKIYGAKTTGGNDIPLQHIPTVIDKWHYLYPDKPVILHLEDENVRTVLEDVYERPNGVEYPIHIAHVSSREELGAIIWAKDMGMNVTCEVTPHHLFATEEARQQVGNYGCMKPSLKTEEDVRFLWGNLKYIDIFASDCAPHRKSDKEGDTPVWGIANHTVMLPLLLGAVEEGRLTMEDLYQKMVINPRERFNLPPNDGSQAIFSLQQDPRTVAEIEAEINPKYGQNMFLHLERLGSRYHLAGSLEYAQSGFSRVRRQAGRLTTQYITSLSHLVV